MKIPIFSRNKIRLRAILPALASVTSLFVVACTAAVSEPSLSPETLASFEHGTFLENLEVAPNGNVIFTNYYAKQLEIWNPETGLQPPISLGFYPVNLIVLDSGYAVVGHTIAFPDIPAQGGMGNRLLILDAAGKIKQAIPLTEAMLLNGMTQLSPNMFLLGDSLTGRVWSLDLTRGEFSPWLENPNLASPEPNRLGLNGLQIQDGFLYMANSGDGSLYRIEIDENNQPLGESKLVATLPGIDDFKPSSDGNIYISTHGDKVLVLRPDGTIDTLIDREVDGNTAVELSSDGQSLYALGTGGLFSGGDGEATLIRVSLPEAE